MDQALVISLVQKTLSTALMIAAPMLGAGLCVGLMVSIFQAVTSISEQTLSLIPKMLAVVGTVLMLLPWIVTVILEFSGELFALLKTVGPGGAA